MSRYPIPGEAFDDRLAIFGTAGSGKTYLTLGAIARLLESPPERTRLARAAKSIVIQFDWKHLGRKQRALYRELMKLPIHPHSDVV